MISEKSFTERRRFLRLPLAIDVYYKAMDEIIDTGGLKASRARNFSAGGILFRSAFRMESGAIIQMMLEFTHAGRRRRVPVVARVARCRPLGKRSFEIGAGFLNVFPKDLEILEAVAKKKPRKAR